MMPNIESMFLTFGIIAGLGLGMCYVTAVVCIAYWFDKKRTLATGLGACGKNKNNNIINTKILRMLFL